jgi:hypothetical protein
VSEAPGGRRTGIRRWRALFALYALALFTGTHWPQLRLPAGDVPRPDLIVHVLAFGGFAFLAQRCRFFGEGRRNAIGALALSFAYAAFDEGTQAIPVLRRQAVWIDFYANVLGVVAGTIAGVAYASIASKRARGAGEASA